MSARQPRGKRLRGRKNEEKTRWGGDSENTLKVGSGGNCAWYWETHVAHRKDTGRKGRGAQAIGTRKTGRCIFRFDCAVFRGNRTQPVLPRYFAHRGGGDKTLNIVSPPPKIKGF